MFPSEIVNNFKHLFNLIWTALIPNTMSGGNAAVDILDSKYVL